MTAELNLRWEDPPGPAGRPPFDVNAPEFDELRANPKRWARLYDYEKEGSGQSRASKLRQHLKEQGFEFTARKTPTGSTVYGRYMPTENA